MDGGFFGVDGLGESKLQSPRRGVPPMLSRAPSLHNATSIPGMSWKKVEDTSAAKSHRDSQLSGVTHPTGASSPIPATTAVVSPSSAVSSASIAAARAAVAGASPGTAVSTLAQAGSSAFVPGSGSAPPASANAAGANANVDAAKKAEEAAKGKKEEVTLTFPDGRVFKFPLLSGTWGPKAIDIRTLYDVTGAFTYDPGYTSTCSCDSSITYIDGPQGILTYRGYDINELVEKSDVMEVSFLLLYGELPSPRQKAIHMHDLNEHRMIHEKLIQFYKGFKSDAHPMAIMVGVVGALSAFYHDSLDINDPQSRALACYRLIAKMPTIAAIAYKTSIGHPIVYPRDDLSYSENFLYMMFAVPTRPYTIDPALVRALDVFLILHMDHEQNASTSTVRIAGSSKANPFACVASGIAALWGPSHGGANEEVLNMLQEIGSKERIPEFIKRAKDKNDSFRLMGFGHRVYKNFDPRAVFMRKVCYGVLDALGVKKEPLLELAVELEKAALKDEYFIQRKLFPNVDFYSGIALRAMGIPVSMFTVLFAVARTVGWISQWKEMIEQPGQKIGRPRQLYLGSTQRTFTPMERRPETIADDAIQPARAGKTVGVTVKTPGD